TVATHAVHRLQMALVVDVGLGARVDGGDVEGEAHALLLQDHPGAVPGFGYNLALGCFAGFQGTYDHVLSVAEDAVFGTAAAVTVAKAASRMSVAVRVAAAPMVSGHRHLAAWLWLPLVSMTRPRSEAAAQMAAAVSPSGQLMPAIIARP